MVTAATAAKYAAMDVWDVSGADSTLSFAVSEQLLLLSVLVFSMLVA